MERSRISRVTAMAAFLAAGFTAIAAPAWAETDVPVLAGNCGNCHGPDGRSPGSIPGIAGNSFAVLKAQLLAYKADEIPGTTVMNRLAKGYSDAELEAIAQYFAAIKAKGAQK